MTIKEVSEQYGISQDTLRYYEKIGVIPKIQRSAGGIRQYSEEDINWVKNAICMRNAGMSVEKLMEYVKLCKLGEETFQARKDLLMEVREEIREQIRQYETALERLDYKIGKYEEAVRTGKLVWDTEDCT